MPPTFRVPRTVRAVAALLVLVVLAAVTYQGVATAMERRRFPHPGRLVDVGGHQLHILCTGTGRPTVVLEAAAAGVSVAWDLVQHRLAMTTRVCSYDRAGLGWSERGDGPYDPERAAVELRQLLEAAKETGPFLVAGQGLGASFAALFAARFPDATAAAVLLDAPEPGRESDDRHVLGRFPDGAPWLARAGFLRLGGRARRDPALSDAADGARRSFLNRPDHLTRAALEIAEWDQTVRLAAAAAEQAPPGLLSRATSGRIPPTTAESADAAETAIAQAIDAVRRRRR